MEGRILTVRQLGLQDYEPVVARMQAFTDSRDDSTPDELWLLEHPPVYTLGRAARSSHVLAPGNIPVISTDRGGQVSYHGPGQLIAYPLIDLGRLGIGIRPFVDRLEQAIIDLLAGYGIEAGRRKGAPGVYVDDCKIAALGLRVRRGCSYHGLSLNVTMDLAPFSGIDPCGLPGLAVTQLSDLVEIDRTADTGGLAVPGEALARHLTRLLGYDKMTGLP